VQKKIQLTAATFDAHNTTLLSSSTLSSSLLAHSLKDRRVAGEFIWLAVCRAAERRGSANCCFCHFFTLHLSTPFWQPSAVGQIPAAAAAGRATHRGANCAMERLESSIRIESNPIPVVLGGNQRGRHPQSGVDGMSKSAPSRRSLSPLTEALS
jgi:hypothetical protein